MKHFRLRELFISLFVTLIASGVGMSTPVHADADVPLGITMRLTATSVMQGESIVLHYSITNLGDQQIGAEFGVYNDAWYTLGLMDQTGHSVGQIPDLRPIRPASSFYRIPSPFLLAGQTRSGDIVLTRLYAIPRPGKYILSVNVHLPAVEMSVGEENPSRVEEAIKASPTDFTNTYKCSFIVTTADSASLQAKAEGLRHTTMQNGVPADVSLSVDRLLSMPTAVALPSWQALITGTNGKPDLVVRSLSSFPSFRAADILADMAWDASWQQSKYSADRTLTALREMRETPDVGLRQHIDELLATHGIRTTDVPQAVD